MKLLLAVICFITMLLHAFFGYYLYTQGENIFYPEKVKAMLLEIVPQQPNVQPPAAQSPVSSPAAPALAAPQPTPTATPQPAEPAPTPSAEPAAPAAQPQEAPAAEHNSAVLSLPKSTLASVATLISSEVFAEEAGAIIQDFKMDDFGAKYRAIMDSLGISPLLQAPNPPVAHPAFDTGWSGYLQIQNALITFFLFILGIAVCCVSGRGSASRWVFAINFFFWISLGCFTWFWHPINTPLAVIRLNFSFPGWYFIVGVSMFGALISLLLFFAAMRSKEIPLKKGTPDVVKQTIEQSKLPPQVKKEVEAVAEEASRADPAAAQFAGQVVEGEQETKRSVIKEVGALEKKVKAEVSKVEQTIEKEESGKGGFSFGRKAKKKEAAVAAAAVATATATAKGSEDDQSASASATAQSPAPDSSEKVSESTDAKPSIGARVVEELKDFAEVAKEDIDKAHDEFKDLDEEKKTDEAETSQPTEKEHPIVDTGSKVLRNLQNENGIKEDDSVIVTPPPEKS